LPSKGKKRGEKCKVNSDCKEGLFCFGYDELKCYQKCLDGKCSDNIRCVEAIYGKNSIGICYGDKEIGEICKRYEDCKSGLVCQEQKKGFAVCIE
jgi:hypothetical protein